MKVVAVPSMVSLDEEEFKVMRPSDDGQTGTSGGEVLCDDIARAAGVFGSVWLLAMLPQHCGRVA
jgi:hypothetical protein